MRATFTFKARGMVSTQGGQQRNGVFVYVADDAELATLQAIGAALETIFNGTLVSITTQVWAAGDGVALGDAAANGGTWAARALFRNDSRDTENVNLPFLRANVSNEQVEAALEDIIPHLLNHRGDPIGQLVHVRTTERVDGARV